MYDVKAAVSDIENTFDASRYPTEFLGQYDQLECLAASHGTETFLVMQKDSERLFVAKCYDKGLFAIVHESDILKNLHHSGFPAYVDEFQNDQLLCIVREYVDGKPLHQHAVENRLNKRDAAGICIQLCDILIHLHGQKEPIIHRDIKPQNIIVRPDGKISLIDFDISRVYHTDVETDTQFLGTREYAPPEQYGFSQTDCRADTYSVGVVLGWLLTGETDSKKVSEKLGHDRLAGIYKKCTSFSPEDRFASAGKLKSALINADGRRQKAALRWTAAILSCLILLGAGFSIGRYTDFLKHAPEGPVGVAFEEPMIEQAVRLQLGKAAGDTITEDELLSVTGLYVFGDSLISKNEEELHAAAELLFESDQMKEGSIRSLSDLSKMPNLKQIFICMQQITEVSPLATLQNLEVVDLKNNPITDISPLGELKFLKRVTLFDTRVTDLSPLAKCVMLSVLDAGKLPIRSPAAFEGLNGLQNLSLYETTIDTLAGIEGLTQLKFIEVTGIIDGDLSPLLSLPYLENVVLGEDMKIAAEAIEAQANFTITFRQE